MNEYCKKISLLIYGNEILYAMELDDIMREMHRFNRFVFRPEKRELSFPEEETWRNLSHLIRAGSVTGVADSTYSLTQSGRIFLANGGYTTEAKKSKNALFAFRISLASITISIITFLLYIFNRS
jgi:hypothetical protein